jgi:hypothetical protein
MKSAINEPFHDTNQSLRIEDIPLSGIRKLLQTYTLSQPTTSTGSPQSPIKSLELSSFHYGNRRQPSIPAVPTGKPPNNASEKWRPFSNPAGSYSVPLIRNQNPMRKITSHLSELTQPDTQLPQYTKHNCFETLRLSVDLALAPAPLRTPHPSP